MIRTGVGDYHPTEDEEYMNHNQLEYFRNYLLSWRSEVLATSLNFVQGLKDMEIRCSDLRDLSRANAGMAIDLQTRDHQKRLLEQLDYALNRIAEGEYGYCEITDEEIGLKRLMARPVATMCVEVQERYERLVQTSARTIFS